MKQMRASDQHQGEAVDAAERLINSISDSFASIQDMILCSNPSPGFVTADGRHVGRKEHPAVQGRRTREESHFNCVFHDTERIYRAAVVVVA
eukprot:497317-Hanusia_phi.AAC.2